MAQLFSLGHTASMPFTDDNTIEDIMGCYLVASYWRKGESDTDIHQMLAEFVERIEDKLARNRNKTRHSWFTIALDYAKQAQQHYRDGQIEAGRELLQESWEQLESGNKASRRHTTFVVSADGGIQHV